MLGCLTSARGLLVCVLRARNISRARLGFGLASHPFSLSVSRDCEIVLVSVYDLARIMEDDDAVVHIHTLYVLVQQNLTLFHETHLVHQEAASLYEASLNLYHTVIDLATRESVEVCLRNVL